MTKRRSVFFWWWPGFGWASLWYGPRYYWEWCLPQRDHWHIGPLSFYYSRKLMAKAADEAAQDSIDRRWDSNGNSNPIRFTWNNVSTLPSTDQGSGNA